MQWEADVLGAGFEASTLDLGEDSEGPLVATLVRSLPEPRSFTDWLFRRHRPLEDIDVLYVHGWSDYFFQRSLAKFWTDRGARFFALDLRRYGRSLREGQTAGYIEDLEEYDEEINLALAAMREEGAVGAKDGAGAATSPRRLMLFGHSTGGLVLTLWAARNPGHASAILLNSPWLEFQLTGAARQVLARLINFSARINPHEAGPQLDYGHYSRAQREVGPHADLDTINSVWRPERAHPVHSGWLRAVLAGHAKVSGGLNIEAPVLTLLSAHSATPLLWGEELLRTDTVLDVEEVAQAALKLGPSLTVERLNGALHDVFLSGAEVRAEAYHRLDRWLTGWAAADRLGSLHGS